MKERFRPNSFGSLAMLDAMRCPESVTNLTADRRAVVVMVAETSIERDQPVALALSGVLAACPSCQDFKPVAMPTPIGSATAIPTSDKQAGAVAPSRGGPMSKWRGAGRDMAERAEALERWLAGKRGPPTEPAQTLARRTPRAGGMKIALAPAPIFCAQGWLKQ